MTGPLSSNVAAQQSCALRARLERRAEISNLDIHCASLQMNVKTLHGRDKRHKTYNMYIFIANGPKAPGPAPPNAGAVTVQENVFLNSFLVTRGSTEFDADWVQEHELFVMSDGPGSAIRGRDLGPERPCVTVALRTQSASLNQILCF